MIKYIVNKLNLFLISIIFSSELLSLEILEVKMMDSYKITREFPGKLLPVFQNFISVYFNPMLIKIGGFV